MAKAKKAPRPQPIKVPGIPYQHANPKKYRVDYVAIAKRATDAGYTNDEVAFLLGISNVTMWRWKRDHPNFKAAVAMKETTAKDRAELSAFNQAVGFYIDDEEIKVVNGQIVRVPTRKFIPPDANMTKYWLAVKAGWRIPEADLPPPLDDQGQTIDGIPEESDRQRARRIAFMLIQGGKKEAG